MPAATQLNLSLDNQIGACLSEERVYDGEMPFDYELGLLKIDGVRR